MEQPTKRGDKMTEKRYYTHRNKVHDKICHNFMDIEETVEHMNTLYEKYKALKKEKEELVHECNELYLDKGSNEYYKDLYKETKEELGVLKSELHRIHCVVEDSIRKVH
jgi:ASC-1-like (ASCH) protein